MSFQINIWCVLYDSNSPCNSSPGIIIKKKHKIAWKYHVYSDIFQSAIPFPSDTIIVHQHILGWDKEDHTIREAWIVISSVKPQKHGDLIRANSVGLVLSNHLWVHYMPKLYPALPDPVTQRHAVISLWMWAESRKSLPSALLNHWCNPINHMSITKQRTARLLINNADIMTNTGDYTYKHFRNIIRLEIANTFTYFADAFKTCSTRHSSVLYVCSLEINYFADAMPWFTIWTSENLVHTTIIYNLWYILLITKENEHSLFLSVSKMSDI